MRETTRQVVSSIERTTNSIRRVDEVVTSIASAVEEQNAATLEIARNVQEVAGANQTVTDSIGDVNTDTETTHALAEDLGESATVLKSEAGSLTVETERFLKEIKAI